MFCPEAISPLIKSMRWLKGFSPLPPACSAAAQAGQQRQTTNGSRTQADPDPRCGDPGQRNISPKHLLTDRWTEAQLLSIPQNDPDSMTKTSGAAIPRLLDRGASATGGIHHPGGVFPLPCYVDGPP